MATESDNLSSRPLQLDLADCCLINDFLSFDRTDQYRPLTSPEKRLRTRRQAVDLGATYFGEVLEQASQVIGICMFANIGNFPDGGRPLASLVIIHPDHRRKGHGRKLFERGVIQVRQKGFDRIYTNLNSARTDEMKFIQSAGFQDLDHQHELKLDLSDYPDDKFEYVMLDGMELWTIGELRVSVPDWAAKLHELCTSFIRDIPSRTGLAEGFSDTPEELETKLLTEIEINQDSSYVLLVGGVWAATAWMSKPEKGQDSCYQVMSGVRPDYRRRGFIKLIKRAGFNWCRKAGIRYIHTHQHDTNKPMLELNLSLGFTIKSTSVISCLYLDEQESELST